MAFKRAWCVPLFFLLSLLLLNVNSNRISPGSHRTIGRFDNGEPDYSEAEEEQTGLANRKEVLKPGLTNRKEVQKPVETVKDGTGSKNLLLTPAQKTNLLGDLIDLITTGIRNFSINDAIAIGVFIIAIVGIKIIVIGILVGIWVGVEKYGGKGGYEQVSSGYGYGASPQVSYGYEAQTTYGAPSINYGSPAVSYGKPASAYGTPSNNYGTPVAAYSTPAPAYGAPAPVYGTPAPAYGTPAPAYGKPATNYGTPSYSTYSSSRKSSSRGFTNEFDQIGAWILKSVTNYVLNSNNKAGNHEKT